MAGAVRLATIRGRILVEVWIAAYIRNAVLQCLSHASRSMVSMT